VWTVSNLREREASEPEAIRERTYSWPDVPTGVPRAANPAGTLQHAHGSFAVGPCADRALIQRILTAVVHLTVTARSCNPTPPEKLHRVIKLCELLQ
jgi:hypothetical protein